MHRVATPQGRQQDNCAPTDTKQSAPTTQTAPDNFKLQGVGGEHSSPVDIDLDKRKLYTWSALVRACPGDNIVAAGLVKQKVTDLDRVRVHAGCGVQLYEASQRDINDAMYAATQFPPPRFSKPADAPPVATKKKQIN